jgi:hypothetical protein
MLPVLVSVRAGLDAVKRIMSDDVGPDSGLEKLPGAFDRPTYSRCGVVCLEVDNPCIGVRTLDGCNISLRSEEGDQPVPNILRFRIVRGFASVRPST